MRTLKGAVPIRTLTFAIIVGISFVYAYVGWIGGYQIHNNIPTNATLKGQYEAVTGNGIGIFSTGNLSNQASIQGGQFGLTTALNTVGMVGQFLKTIPATFSAISTLTIGSLGTYLGISLSVFQTNVMLLVAIIIVIAILSAIFLFPI